MVAATMFVTTAGAGAKDGTTWGNAFGFAEWETNFEGSAEAGDIYYVEEGTYTLTSNFDSFADATVAAPVNIIGVKSGTTNEPPVASDFAFGTARPLLATGANRYFTKKFWNTKNIRLTGTGSAVFFCSQAAIIENCKVENSSGTSARDAFNIQSENVKFILCEIVSTNGEGIDGGGGKNFVAQSCYIHDSDIGANVAGNSAVINCVIDTCAATGLLMTGVNNKVIGNTIYNCGDGIAGSTTASEGIYTNNILDANTVGIDWDNTEPTNFFDNNVYDNTTDVNNVTKGPNSVTGDPGLTDPASGDFTLGSGSNAIDAGMKINTDAGVTGIYKENIGVDQDDVTTGGGASAYAHF